MQAQPLASGCILRMNESSQCFVRHALELVFHFVNEIDISRLVSNVHEDEVDNFVLVRHNPRVPDLRNRRRHSVGIDERLDPFSKFRIVMPLGGRSLAFLKFGDFDLDGWSRRL
jgi:hypothetical protein